MEKMMYKSMNKIVMPCALIILAFTVQAQAKIIAWKDNIPSSLQPFQNNAQLLAGFAQDKIIIYAHPAVRTSVPTASKNPNPTATFTSSAIVLPISSATVAKTLSQYDQYVGLFPTLKSAKLVEKSGNNSQMKYKVSIPTPIPVLNFNEDIIFQHQLGNNSLSSIVIDAPVPYGIGKFEWFSLGDNKTLVTLTQWSDLNQPKGFLFSQILKSVPEAKMGIPGGTNAFILESLRKKFINLKTSSLKPGEFPQPNLTQSQLNQLVQISRSSQQPVSFIDGISSVPYQHGRENLRFVTSYQYNPLNKEQLQKWLKPNAYQAIFPRQIKKINITDESNTSQNADIKVSVGLGVITIPFDFKLNFKYPDTSSNQFYANGGDLKYVKGQMDLQNTPQGTLFRLTSAVKIDDQAPFLLRAVRSLPYHDLLPAVGANHVFLLKVKNTKS